MVFRPSRQSPVESSSYRPTRRCSCSLASSPAERTVLLSLGGSSWSGHHQAGDSSSPSYCVPYALGRTLLSRGISVPAPRSQSPIGQHAWAISDRRFGAGPVSFRTKLTPCARRRERIRSATRSRSPEGPSISALRISSLAVSERVDSDLRGRAAWPAQFTK